MAHKKGQGSSHNGRESESLLVVPDPAGSGRSGLRRSRYHQGTGRYEDSVLRYPVA